MRLRGIAVSVALALLAGAWAGTAKAAEPDHVVLQHILISFKGKLEGKPVTRSKKEAKELAFELFERAVAGEEFDPMVKEYTDDSYPGRIALANLNAPVLKGERGRKEMVGKFGDIGFRLEVGEVGIATYNSYTSPYGWHVIKRLE